jgi:hypothetical protein
MFSSTKPTLLQVSKRQTTSFQTNVPKNYRTNRCFHSNAWQTLQVWNSRRSHFSRASCWTFYMHPPCSHILHIYQPWYSPTKTSESLSIIFSWAHCLFQMHLHWLMHSTLPQESKFACKPFYYIDQNSSRSRLKIWSNISFITHYVDQILIKTLGKRLVGMHTKGTHIINYNLQSNNMQTQ